jgi:hypothetical protein
MSPLEIAALLAMTGYAIYKQTSKHEITGAHRFTLAAVYALVGIGLGGFALPTTGLAVALLVVSIALSAAVGIARGRLTRLWIEDGRAFVQGTALTVSLFLGLVAAKFALGTAAYLLHVQFDGGFGEVLVMVSIMVAVQAEIVWRRAQRLTREQHDQLTTQTVAP